jgi:hypothetical protein
MNRSVSSSTLQPGWLLGTWEVRGTTANVTLPDFSYHHFDSQGRYFLELAFGAGGRIPWFESIYREQQDGYWTSFDPAQNPPVGAWFRRFVPCARSFDEIVVTGHSGDLWWIRRMPAPASFLRLHVDPLTGRLSQRGIS